MRKRSLILGVGTASVLALAFPGWPGWVCGLIGGTVGCIAYWWLCWRRERCSWVCLSCGERCPNERAIDSRYQHLLHTATCAWVRSRRAALTPADEQRAAELVLRWADEIDPRLLELEARDD
jgi:hypothetical protein